MSAARMLLGMVIAGVLVAALGGRARPAAGQGEVTAQAVGNPIGNPFLICSMTDDQLASAVAYNSQDAEYLVVWYNDRATGDDIYARRVSAITGKPLGACFPVATGGAGVERRNPDVAYNSARNEYLVVWEQDSGTYLNIVAQRVLVSGSATGGQVTLGSGAALRNRWDPAVAYASGADSYLVVWESMVVAGVAADIQAQVVSGSGTPTGSNFIIAQGTWEYDNSQPDLAYNSNRGEYLVVWSSHFHLDADHDIYGRRVWADGTLQSPDHIIIGYYTSDETEPAVAAVPTSLGYGWYMVVWQLKYSASDDDIYACPVAGAGIPGSSFAVVDSGADETRPAVAGNAKNQQYLVAWTEPWGAVTGVRARQLSMAGTALTEPLWLAGDNAENAAVSSGRLGDYLAAFDSLPPPYTTARDIYGRLWGWRTHSYLPAVMHQ